ncbi:MAG: hypothetical protein KA144_12325, partial [Xanthomonadaceae bacterium]|nr:hypothetical protein [Xanthomonadaceae bacterium]
MNASPTGPMPGDIDADIEADMRRIAAARFVGDETRMRSPGVRNRCCKILFRDFPHRKGRNTMHRHR